MEKIKKFSKILIINILILLININKCFANAAIDPMTGKLMGGEKDPWYYEAPEILFYIVCILSIFLIISLIIMLISKINKSEEVLKKSKTFSENLLYYILFILGLIASLMIFSTADYSKNVFDIICFIFPLISIILRLINKNKKWAYITFLMEFIYLIFYVILKVIF